MARFTLFDSQQRQGTVYSASVDVPPGEGDFQLTLALPQNEVADPANTMLITLEGSWDGGQGWEPLVSARWHGGTLGRDGSYVQPSVGLAFDRARPTPGRVRLMVDTSRRIRFACVLDTALRSLRVQ